MKINRKTVLSIAYALLFLPGVAACFLTFTQGTSPFDVVIIFAEGLWEFWGELLGDFWGQGWQILAMAVPFFLAFPILWAKSRAVFASRINKFEIIAFYISALLALIAECYLVVALSCVSLFFSLMDSIAGYIPDWGEILQFACIFVVPLIVGLAYVLALLRKRISHNITSVICMELAWIVNTIFCVMVFWGGLKIGAWMAVFAGAVYLVDIKLLTRRGWRERANEEI